MILSMLAVMCAGLMTGSLANTLEQEPARGVATPAVQAPRPVPTAAADTKADAYFQFIRGRQLEERGDIDGAVAAYRRALEWDPSSAVLHAELATLFARQGRIAEAKAEADAGFALDRNNSEIRRLLGMLAAEAARSDDATEAATPTAQAAARTAVEHFEQALPGATPGAASGIRLALGRLYLQLKDTDKAIATLQKLIVDEPGTQEAVTLLVEIYQQTGRTDAALTTLQDAVQSDPMFYAALGEAYEKAERWDEAAGAYERAAAVRPRDGNVKTHWALALLNLDGVEHVTRARDLLLEVTRLSPGNGWALYLLARAHRELGELGAAEALARRLLVLSPTSISAAHVLAQVLAEQRNFQGVIEALVPIVDKMPSGHDHDLAVLHSHLGFAYLETDRVAEGLASFERAHTLQPGDVGMTAYYAQALNTARQFDKALALVRAQRKTAPDEIRLARAEADALRGKGKIDEGAAVLQVFVTRESGSEVPRQMLAEYLASARRYAAAIEVLQQALEVFPGQTDVEFQLGAMFERQQRYADAERTFRSVLGREPEHCAALNYLGYMLAERGERLPEALELVKRAVALEPFNPAFADSLGWVYYRMGNLETAETYLKSAAAQLGHDSAVQEHWGDYLARRGRMDEAVAAWKRALSGDNEGIDRATVERKIKQASTPGVRH